MLNALLKFSVSYLQLCIDGRLKKNRNVISVIFSFCFVQFKHAKHKFIAYLNLKPFLFNSIFHFNLIDEKRFKTGAFFFCLSRCCCCADL